GRERQRDPTGPDGELERCAVARQLREPIDRRAEHVGVEHRGMAVVVAGGDVLAEVVHGHAHTVALTSAARPQSCQRRRRATSATTAEPAAKSSAPSIQWATEAPRYVGPPQASRVKSRSTAANTCSPARHAAWNVTSA